MKEGLGVINYFPLGGGFLSGKYRIGSGHGKQALAPECVKKYFNERGLKILEALDEVAKR